MPRRAKRLASRPPRHLGRLAADEGSAAALRPVDLRSAVNISHLFPIPLDAFLVSAGVVALGEIGDKTQLLALMLSARFRKPLPIIAGIVVATLANHALAGWLGNLMRNALPPNVLRWAVALSFFAVALWALKPDRLDEGEAPRASRWGVFGVTAVAFFLAEIGDKTQVATMVLAARFDALLAVILGTTLGMLVADVPVVLIGKSASGRIPFKAVRIAAAIVFAVLGVFALLAPV